MMMMMMMKIILIIIIISLEQLADKRGFVRRKMVLFYSNTETSRIKRNYKKYILKQPNIDELCRRCGKESETTQHITAACDQLTPTEYVMKRDGVAKFIRQKLAEASELIEDRSPY
jgi:hypothetical protein